MSRLSIACNVVLATVVVAQGWVLFARGDGTIAEPLSARSAALAADGTDAGSTDASAALASQLARIDARLAALERSQPAADAMSPTSTAPSQPSSPPISSSRIDPQRAAAADRRLAAMLADDGIDHRNIDHRSMQRFRIAIAGLPPEEQIAMSAAFSRAVNEDRVRLRF
jgi:hypothetical protein